MFGILFDRLDLHLPVLTETSEAEDEVSLSEDVSFLLRLPRLL